jgi:beta-phosphoglucomutase-like phosphatase (HAD superfamily)
VAIEDSAAGATSAVRAGLDVIAIARHPADLALLAAVGVRVVERLEPALLGL